MENTLTAELRELLLQNGADMVGVGDLTPLPAGQRCGMPLGVCVAVKFPKEVIRGIGELPTPAYKQWYDDLNDRLDALVTQGAELLKSRGYQAQGQTRAQVGRTNPECLTRLPYKTVATRAGLGWIGKSALLVTEEYGSMVRLASILTDAPLTPAEPVQRSRCGGCTACRNACPAGAIRGTAWAPELERDVLLDYQRCRETALDRSEKGFGQRTTICGKCIEVCPYTRRYLENGEPERISAPPPEEASRGEECII